MIELTVSYFNLLQLAIVFLTVGAITSLYYFVIEEEPACLLMFVISVLGIIILLPVIGINLISIKVLP